MRDVTPVYHFPVAAQIDHIVDSFGFQVKPLYEDRSFLYQKYVVEGLSSGEIAALSFSCRTTIMKRLRGFGIPIREACEYKVRAQLAYGESVRSRKAIRNRRELETLKKIQSLYEQGFNFWKIATVLNSWGVPTKTGRGRWHARYVQKIIVRDSRTIA